MASYQYKWSFHLTRHFIHGYTQWIDGYILGNMLKLVNSAIEASHLRRPVKIQDAPKYANVACYFGHFIMNEQPRFITMPFYITYRSIKKDEEIMTYYPL